MSVAQCHRFLYGETPRTVDKRIWVLSGQIDDAFFYNTLYGCVGLRRTLELWALEDGVQLVVFVNRQGEIDFSGNPDPTYAEQLFRDVRPLREPPNGLKPRKPRGVSTITDGQSDQNEQAQQQAQQAASAVESTVGGQGSGILNTFTMLSQLVSNKSVKSLIIMEDFTALYQNLQRNQATAATADEILYQVSRVWHKDITHANQVIFFSYLGDIPFMQSEVYNTDEFKRVDFKSIPGPSDKEILHALERLTHRKNFSLRGAETVASQLVRYENLTGSLDVIRRIYNEGERSIVLDHVLRLPPINVEESARIKVQVHSLVGLHDVKVALDKMESEAYVLRKNLASGSSNLPEKTMHMVFTGSPGTGKTMVAKLVAKFFYSIGLLRKSEVKEIIASSVMSQYAGETRKNMQAELDAARGGVLFIDEAHQFGDKDSAAAKEAIQALVPLAWNYRTETIIILAGYADRMLDFFAMDQGLDRRFPQHLRTNFPDYTLDELLQIFRMKLDGQGYTSDEGVEQRVLAILGKRMRRSTFGNAGGVDNFVGEIITNHAVSKDPSSRVITLDDLPPLVRRDQAIYEEAMRELDDLVGLDEVRQRVQTIVNKIEYGLEEEGVNSTGSVDLHAGNMLFVGPPGTGKTTVGSIIARLLYGIGCLDRPIVVEVSRDNLIGVVQGESGQKVVGIVDQARDGLLFIDEAYGLMLDQQDMYGKEAVTVLVKQVTSLQNAGTVFVLAGYEQEIHQFLRSNPGLARRFPQIIHFPNFGPDACVELARREFARQRRQFEDGVLEAIAELAARAIQEQGDHFGNAGWVKSLVSDASENMINRIVGEQIRPEDRVRRTTVTLADLPGLTERAGSSDAYTQQKTKEFVDSLWKPQENSIRVISAGENSILLKPNWKSGNSWKKEIGKLMERSAFQILVDKSDGKRATASGFFVTGDCVMVTNHHVIDKSNKIEVLCGANRAPCLARVLAANYDLDLALIVVKTETPPPALILGDSFGPAAPDEVMVYGNAHVLPGEPGRLIVARVARNDSNNPRYIETDGDIEEGFSGGPVYDLTQGAVIGVVMGGHGRSATLHVRAEQVRNLLSQLGYTFKREYHNEEQ